MTVDDRLDLSVALGRDNGGAASGLQVGENGVGVPRVRASPARGQAPSLSPSSTLGSGPGSAMTGA
jgi:hypothetical protein